MATKQPVNKLEIIRDLYNACKRYEEKYKGLLQWEIPSFNEAKKILTKSGFPEHEEKNVKGTWGGKRVSTKPRKEKTQVIRVKVSKLAQILKINNE